MKEFIKKHGKYIAWNVLVMGILVFGNITKTNDFAGKLIGGLYCVIIPLYCIVLFAAHFKTIGKEIDKSITGLKWWEYICEVAFISLTIYMGYKKIAVCEFFELAAMVYLRVLKLSRKENDATK